ncbi:uncharacterized protein BKA55DRAFT_532235 [Fusarium redolens]|uniref:Uncharacterized protein n=1 Tax=Fusarium redolens TaxID=48865 RepID=A0A9P9KWD3_FUSRE|nr:uncharacterized protein BKA55DRAFT_532235 [Fusarium redolens]KAH7269583.1 hypothetical protein BKA55DRAFT_532235 [Fusarium redolens]
MKPLSENSLPYTESDNSARDTRHGRNTTSSSISCHSDPFAKSGIEVEDGVQLRDFSSPGPVMSRCMSPDPNRFVAERPSRLDNADTGLTVPKINELSSDDHAASEWETVAGEDAFESYAESSFRPLRRQGNFNFGNKQQSQSQPNQNLWVPQTHNFELVAPGDPSLRPSVRNVPRSAPRLHSFHSVSSFYSESARNKDPDTRVPCDPEDYPQDNHTQNALGMYSRASSDSDEDPFKYDTDAYSGFLRSSAERENVDEEVKVPVHREEKATRRVPVPDRRLQGEIASLVMNRPLTGTEGDWQTVTTEHAFDSMQQDYHDSIAKGTGSSVADVSDVTERELHLRSYGSADRIIRHPPGNNKYGSYRVRTDRRTKLPVSVPQYGVGPGTYASNTTRNFSQTKSRLPESTTRFSNLFRREPSEQTTDHENILLADLPPKRGSYQSLDSDAAPHGNVQTDETISPDGERYFGFSWNRIRKNLGRDPPKTPLTIFDKPLYKRRFQESNSDKPAHVPHDDFLSKIPRLPFPLVSLPEAAMLQQFKRQSGEEDHSQSAGNFGARGRSNTISTENSPTVPKTPSPAKRSFWPSSMSDGVKRPAPILHLHRLPQAHRPRDSNERVTDMLVSSSAILDTPPPTDPKSSTHRVWYRNFQPSISTARTGIHTPGFSTSVNGRRVGRCQSELDPLGDSPFTQREARLIEEAREDIRIHRQHADMVAQRGKRMFMWVMILTLFFPFIGPIVLYGKLNSTISWYTHGEMQCLTKDQRGTLKQQLLVEAVVYPALIIALSVHYSI